MKTLKKLLSAIIISLMWAGTCQAQLPSDNIVAYFPFKGNATDVSGNGNTTTNLTGVTLTSDRLGQLGSAYSFNGKSSIIKLPNQLLPSNTSFAISCWVKTDGIHSTTEQWQAIIDLRGQYQIALYYFQSNYSANPNSFQFVTYSSPTTSTVNSPNNSAKLNTWQHIVCNYGNNTMELYLDGSLIGSQAANLPGIVTGYNNTIGKDYSVAQNRGWFKGNIDEVILYKRKLTSAEVIAIYNRQKIQSEIPELYAPGKISFNYDLAGNMTSRNNVIILKSSKFINEPDTVNALYNIQDQAALFEKDSLKYTDLDQKIKIYPNPTQGQLLVELSGVDPSDKIGIYVYGSTGKLLKHQMSASTREIIDLSIYPNGVYVLRILIGEGVSEWKIIKE